MAKAVVVNPALLPRGPIEWPADKCEPSRHVRLRGPLKGCACGYFSDDDPTGYHARDKQFFSYTATVGSTGTPLTVTRSVTGARNFVRQIRRDLAGLRSAQILTVHAAGPREPLLY